MLPLIFEAIGLAVLLFVSVIVLKKATKTGSILPIPIQKQDKK